jgi:hypothetical protein
VHYLKGLGKCWVGASHLHKGLRVGMGGWWVVHGLNRKDSGKWGCGGV